MPLWLNLLVFALTFAAVVGTLVLVTRRPACPLCGNGKLRRVPNWDGLYYYECDRCGVETLDDGRTLRPRL